MSIFTTKRKDKSDGIEKLDKKTRRDLEKALFRITATNLENKVLPLFIKEQKDVKNIMALIRTLKAIK